MIGTRDIVTKEADLIKIIDQDIWMEIFSDQIHHTIMNSLNKGCKTIEEIYNFYTEAGEGNKKAVERTLYRHVKLLYKKGFLIKAGKRFKPGQRAAKTLISRSAIIFIPTEPVKEMWLFEKGIDASRITGKILEHRFENMEFDAKALFIFIQEKERTFMDIERTLLESIAKGDSVHRSINKPEQEVIEDQYQGTIVLESVNKLMGDEGIVFYKLLGWLIWFLKNSDYIKFIPQLKECLKQKSLSKDASRKITKQENHLDEGEQDIIDYERIGFQLIPSEFHQKYVNDLNYKAIKHLLEISNKPMTVKEIHAQHHAKVKEIIEEKQKCKGCDAMIPEDFSMPKPKAENTIYSYLKKMINDGIIVEAGRRIHQDQAFSQILYTSVAKTSFLNENRDEFWKYGGWKRVTYALSQVIKLYLKKDTVDANKFHDFLTGVEKSRMEYFRQLLNNVEPSLIRGMYFQYEELNAVIRILSLIEWLSREKELKSIHSQLLACFN